MDLKRAATVRFRAADGGVTEVKGHIVKLNSVSGRIIIETNAGLTIGADQILELMAGPLQTIANILKTAKILLFPFSGFN